MLQYEGEEELRFPSPELLLWRPLFHFEPLFREREREKSLLRSGGDAFGVAQELEREEKGLRPLWS